MKIAIIGTGLYSTALTYQLQKTKDNDIYLWTEQESLISKFNKSHKFEFLSKKAKFDSNVYISGDYSTVLQDASIIFILVSNRFRNIYLFLRLYKKIFKMQFLHLFCWTYLCI